MRRGRRFKLTQRKYSTKPRRDARSGNKATSTAYREAKPLHGNHKYFLLEHKTDEEKSYCRQDVSGNTCSSSADAGVIPPYDHISTETHHHDSDRLSLAEEKVKPEPSDYEMKSTLIVIEPNYVSSDNDVTPGLEIKCDDVMEDNSGYDDVKEEAFDPEVTYGVNIYQPVSEKCNIKDVLKQDVPTESSQENKKERIFVCDKCCACFNSESQLSSHKLIHNDEAIKSEPIDSKDEALEYKLQSTSGDLSVGIYSSATSESELRIDSVYSMSKSATYTASTDSSQQSLPAIFPNPSVPSVSYPSQPQPDTAYTSNNAGKIIIVEPILDQESSSMQESKCAQVSTSKPTSNHNEEVTERMNAFHCEYCSAFFASITSLTQHAQKHHLKSLSYKCCICDMVCKSYCGQLRHEITHSDSEWIAKGFLPLDLHGNNAHAKAFQRLISIERELQGNRLHKWREIFVKCGGNPPAERNFLQKALVIADQHEEWKKKNLKFFCRICGLCIRNMRLVARHEATHRLVEWTERGLEVPEQKGASLYAQERQLYLEKIGGIEQEWELRFPCTECDAKFKDQITLDVHSEREHSYVTESDLEETKVSVGMETGNFTIHEEGKSFAGEVELLKAKYKGNISSNYTDKSGNTVPNLSICKSHKYPWQQLPDIDINELSATSTQRHLPITPPMILTVVPNKNPDNKRFVYQRESPPVTD